MFEGVRPFDWLMLVVEVLVLAIIAVEGLHMARKSFHNRSLAKRIFTFIIEGQRLENTVPRQSEQDLAVITGWKTGVETWMQSVTTFLQEQCSDQAAASFVHNPARLPLSFRIANDAESHFRTLQMRLDNLKQIMEKPDVYF